MTRRGFWLGVLVISAVAAAAIWYLREPKSVRVAAAPPIPVTATTAQQQDISVYQTGLGTVQAFNRVTVHVRVDGELENIGFTEGQDVKQGQQLAQIDPRPFQAQLDQAKALKARDEAQLANAKLDLDRFTNLAVHDYATRQSVDTQKALIAQLEATIRGDQAAIENAETQLGYTTIISPLDGRTGMRLIDRLQNITSAMKEAPLKVLAYARDDKTKLAEGTLVLIDNEIDAATGTLRLKATFPNDDDALWPGEFVNAHMELEVRPNAVTVPAEVVQRGLNELYVYVVKADSTVERRIVKVGPVRDGVAVIEAGLLIGERVVLDGQFKLKPGAKVAVSPTPKTPKSSAAEKTAEGSTKDAQ
jgi:multidrug efflux system membrane fusion protein